MNEHRTLRTRSSTNGNTDFDPSSFSRWVIDISWARTSSNWFAMSRPLFSSSSIALLPFGIWFSIFLFGITLCQLWPPSRETDTIGFIQHGTVSTCIYKNVASDKNSWHKLPGLAHLLMFYVKNTHHWKDVTYAREFSLIGEVQSVGKEVVCLLRWRWRMSSLCFLHAENIIICSNNALGLCMLCPWERHLYFNFIFS